MLLSVAMRQPTAQGAAPGSTARAGLGARRVHSTTPSGVGSPEATPSVNGLFRKRCRADACPGQQGQADAGGERTRGEVEESAPIDRIECCLGLHRASRGAGGRVRHSGSAASREGDTCAEIHACSAREAGARQPGKLRCNKRARADAGTRLAQTRPDGPRARDGGVAAASRQVPSVTRGCFSREENSHGTRSFFAPARA
jgi:hypothetical protein